jgi:hypothetical protein
MKRGEEIAINLIGGQVDNTTRGRELDGIAQQIGQRLNYSIGVGVKRR